MWIEPSSRYPCHWRFSLEDVGSGQRFGFADLDALIMHLLALMEEQPASPHSELIKAISSPQSDEVCNKVKEIPTETRREQC
jgi:hypothetical protein